MTDKGRGVDLRQVQRTLSKDALGALIDIGTSRQGAVLKWVTRGGEAVFAELRAAGMIGPERGLTRAGGIVRDREIARLDDLSFG